MLTNKYVPDPVYLSLAEETQLRHLRDRELSLQNVDYELIDSIRCSTNKGWALGSEKLKMKSVSCWTVTPKQRGGDRRSKRYRMSH